MTWDELRQKYREWLGEEQNGGGREVDVEALEAINEQFMKLGDAPEWEAVRDIITDAWAKKLHVEKDTWKIYHKLIDDLENVELPEEETDEL